MGQYGRPNLALAGLLVFFLPIAYCSLLLLPYVVNEDYYQNDKVKQQLTNNN